MRKCQENLQGFVQVASITKPQITWYWKFRDSTFIENLNTSRVTIRFFKFYISLQQNNNPQFGVCRTNIEKHITLKSLQIVRKLKPTTWNDHGVFVLTRIIENILHNTYIEREQSLHTEKRRRNTKKIAIITSSLGLVLTCHQAIEVNHMANRTIRPA